VTAEIQAERPTQQVYDVLICIKVAPHPPRLVATMRTTPKNIVGKNRRLWRPKALAAFVFVFASVSLQVTIAAQPDDLVGEIRTYRLDQADTLLDIARRFDLGYVDIRAANPTIDPWLPGAVAILVPTQFALPAAPRRGIVINLAELGFTTFRQSQGR